MATQIQQARQGFKDKQALRAELETKLKAFHKKLMRAMVSSFGITGDILSASDFQNELAEILRLHYGKVGKEFSRKIAPQLPDDVEITGECDEKEEFPTEPPPPPDDEEEDECGTLLFFLFFLFKDRSEEQAAIISETTQDNINTAIARARQDQIDAEGQTDNRTIAVAAGIILARLLAGRTFNIAFFETQSIAELAKDAEARILAGLTLGEIDLDEKSGVTKKWVVRERKRSDPPSAHLAANGQERDLNEAFLVAGDDVRFPTDMTLGALIGAASFCWCSSQINIASLIRKRRTSSIGRS